MIFGHAPIIVPALLKVSLPYQWMQSSRDTWKLLRR
jgi:hypothetical protein